jgi:NADPH2:quinone reductase
MRQFLVALVICHQKGAAAEFRVVRWPFQVRCHGGPLFMHLGHLDSERPVTGSDAYGTLAAGGPVAWRRAMRAVGYYESLPISEAGALCDIDLARPEPDANDLLVAVRATALNPVDVKTRLSKAGADDEPRVLGWDASGEVVGIGASVTDFEIGDAVWYAGDINRPGSNAEFQCVDARIAARKPDSLNHVEAAAMPLTSLTAWECLFDRLGYDAEPSQHNQQTPLLLINGAGGLGSMVLQCCRFAGIPVTATASRESSRKWCLKLDATDVVGHEEIQRLTDGSFPRILCAHDTDAYFAEMARLVAPQGLVCAVASAKQKHDIQALMAKSAGFVWELMFTRSLFQTDDMAKQGEILRKVAQLVDSAVLQTTLTEELAGLSATTFIKAHKRIEQGRMIGKLVVRISEQGDRDM